MIKSPKKKLANNFAFIDSQNLNLGIRSQGWKIDYPKLRLYLNNKYQVKQAFLFIGFIKDNQKLYTSLQKAGFILVFKPTVNYQQDGKTTVKGNVDAELVLHAAAIEYANYDQAIIITGDGDFTCLMEFLIDHDKLLRILTPNDKYSCLLQKFTSYISLLSKIKKSISLQEDQVKKPKTTIVQQKKTSISGRSKP